MQLVNQIIDYFFNKPQLNNPVYNKKAGFIVVFIFIASILSLVMGMFNLIAKPFNMNTFMLIFNFLNGIFLLIFVKKTGKIFIPSQIISFGVYLAAISGGYHTGGIYSLDLQPLLHVPVTAYILYNGRSAIIWLIISLITFGIFYFVEFYTPYHLREGLENMSHFAYYVKRGMFVIYIGAMLIFYESTANKLTEKLFKRTIEVNKLKTEIETQYKLVLDNIGEAVFLLNENGMITYCNSAFSKYIIEPENELIGKSFTDYFKVDKSIFKHKNEKITFSYFSSQEWIFEVKWHFINTNKSENTYLLFLQNITEEFLAEKQIESMREKIARDFHDEMGNKLASISLRSNLLNDMSELAMSDKLKNNLLSIKNNANTVYQSFRDFIWAIDNQSDQMQEVMSYLKDFGEEYIQDYPIEFSTRFLSDKNIKLPIYWSRQIVYIIKEAMTNAVKHSNCKQIELGISLINNQLSIWLKDNGNGFEQNNLKHKRGILNFEKRAKEINCTVVINTKVNEGTIITFIGNL